MVWKPCKTINSLRFLALTVIIVLLLLVGCSDDQQTSGVGEEEKQKVDLVMGHPFSGEHPISREILIPLAEELSEKTDGRITLTIHPGGAITSAVSVYEDVISGAFDMGWTLQGYTAGRYPVTEVIELPFLFSSATEASRVLWSLIEQHPAMQEEYSEVKVIGLWATYPGEILSKEPVAMPEDLTGKRIRFAGPMQEAILQRIGAVPVGMAAPEMYDSLERGVLDGVAIDPSTIESYRLNEVIDNVTVGLQMFVSPQVVFMNLETWNSLSPEDQELIASLTGEKMALKGGEIYDSGYFRGLEMARESDVTIFEVTPEIREAWSNKTSDIIDEWIANMESRGLPGRELYDLTISLIE